MVADLGLFQYQESDVLSHVSEPKDQSLSKEYGNDSQRSNVPSLSKTEREAW